MTISLVDLSCFSNNHAINGINVTFKLTVFNLYTKGNKLLHFGVSFDITFISL